MDLLKSGLEWLSQYTKGDEESSGNLCQQIEISIPGVTDTPGWPLRAIVPDLDSVVFKDAVSLSVQYFTFVVNTKDLHGYLPDRGWLITWNKRVFEVTLKGKFFWEYNDQYNIEIAINTKLKMNKEVMCS